MCIEFFTWFEFIRTSTGLDNTPKNINIIANLIDLAKAMDALRRAFCAPIIVTSGYRTNEVNRAVNGAKYSHHTMGLACDFKAKDMDKLRALVLERIGLYDQVIFYDTFIHISIAPQMRHMLIDKRTR